MTEIRRLDRSQLSPTPAAPTAAAPAATAAAPAPVEDRVVPAAPAPRGVSPAVDASLIAVVASPDRDHTFADIRPDVMRSMRSWNELPAILQELREQANGRKVVLDLAVHGNNGTGLKVTAQSASGEIASITSMAEVNRMVREAGFAPGEILILTEGCNVNRSWAISADGFTASERQSAISQARRLAANHGTALAGTPEVVDHGPTAIDTSYEWRGRGPGTNWISTVLLQHLTQRTEGAPLHDLREYRNRTAPLETENAEVVWVDARRSEMVAQLQGTRFAGDGQAATPPPTSERSEDVPTASSGLPGSTRRFIERLGSDRPAPVQPAAAPNQPTIAPGQPTTVPTPPAPANRPALGFNPPARPGQMPVNGTGARLIDRIGAQPR